jgi:hypothetical protein
MGEDAIIMIQCFCSSSDNIVSIVSAGEREMIDMFACYLAHTFSIPAILRTIYFIFLIHEI